MAIERYELDRYCIAAREWAEQRDRLFHGETERVVPCVDTCCTMADLKEIAKITGETIRDGARGFNGDVHTRHLYYDGVKFWANTYRAD